MEIKKLYKPGKTVFSLEVFPPNKTYPIETVYKAIDELAAFSPAYISVTYGAGGNAADRSTCKIAAYIKEKHGIESMAHLTCINSTKADVDILLDDFKSNGIENILALRGDLKPDVEPKKDFLHASDLTAYIAAKGGFDIAGACYPETHLDAESPEKDIENLKIKVEAGASHLISQLFFDNSFFYDFVKRAKAAGINVPISAGIMPVTNTKQIQRMVTLCGASLPQKFVKIMQKYENNPEALLSAGIAYAADQIVDLISTGVDGIHLYAMNNPTVTGKIYESIKTLL